MEKRGWPGLLREDALLPGHYKKAIMVFDGG
jgi:hypothetical protein